MVKIFRKFAKSFRKFAQILFFKIRSNYWTLQNNFIKFTELLEILKNLQNTDMKKLVKKFQNFD